MSDRCKFAGPQAIKADPHPTREKAAEPETSAAFSGKCGQPGPVGTAPIEPTQALETCAAFDERAAVARFGGSHDMFEQVAALFVEVAPRLVSQISRGICERDAAALARAAHTLSSSADVLAAGPVSRAALEVERLARRGEFDAAAALVPDLELDLRELGLALQASLNSGSEPTVAKDPPQ